MAVVLDPFYSSKARGSIGGITASRSGVGAVLRRKSKPPLRNKGTQGFNRSVLGFCARSYGSITPAQRQYWAEYADDHPQPDGFGGTFILTSEQAYLMLNIVAVARGGHAKLQAEPPVAPPVASVVTNDSEPGVNPGALKVTVTMLGTGIADDKIEAQYAGPFQSKGRVEVHSRFRSKKNAAGNLLEILYTGLQEEAWYWTRARYVDQYGQVTAWIYDQAQPAVTP